MNDQAAGLQIGISSAVITPSVPFALAGMNENEHAMTVHSPLQLQAFVFDSGVEVAVLITADLLNVATETVGTLRHAISRMLPGRPVTVMVACSHTHSAPYTTYFAGRAADRDYIAHLCRTAVEVVSRAYETRRPAVVGHATVAATGLSANRRVVLNNDQVATHAPATAPDFSRFEGPVDDEVSVAWFTDSGGAVIGGLVNFACHPTLTGFDSCASADFPAQLRASLEVRYGGILGFLQGASGDVSPCDSPTREVVGTQAADDLGRQLAELAGDAIDAEGTEIRQSSAPIVAGASRTLTIGQRLATADRVELAHRYLAGEIADSSPSPETNRLLCGFDYSFYGNPPAAQRWFAREMIGMWEWQQRATIATPTEQVEVQILRVNDLLIAGLPVELFTQLGLEVKAAARDTAVMISTLTNGYHGYVPTKDAFEHGGYETRLGYQSRLAPDAGPYLVASACDLIAELIDAPSHESTGSGRTP